MGEPKPLASLTSGLLARKGAARPAMRRQPLGSGPAPLTGNGYDDLGWNDMGYDVDPVQANDTDVRIDLKAVLTESMPAHNHDAETAVDANLQAEKPEVLRQFEELQARIETPVVEIAAPAASAKPVRRSAVRRAPAEAHQREKAAFTLRLDAERHLRLRLASAIYNRSAQHILIDVLDNYLSALPEIDAMASRVPASPSNRKSTSRTSDGE
jgi:hypothetical protein